jgi:HSP20 family protein
MLINRGKAALILHRPAERTIHLCKGLKTKRAGPSFKSMDPTRGIKLRWLHGALHDVTYELARSRFSQFAPHTWEPAINAYRCESCIRICVDLAGVDRSQIDLTIEPRRLIIRGARELPEPTHAEGRAVQLLAMEIDYGPFEREVSLPAEVEIDKAHAEPRNGLLWISLPLKP